MTFRLKRVYEVKSEQDGFRVLVDRLWPRGLSKTEAAIDLWLRDIAPSTALRVWFDHDPEKWTEFRRRYHAELRVRTPAIQSLRGKAKTGPVTLVYAARDERHNHAVALRDFLQKPRGPRSSTGTGSNRGRKTGRRGTKAPTRPRARRA